MDMENTGFLNPKRKRWETDTLVKVSKHCLEMFSCSLWSLLVRNYATLLVCLLPDLLNTSFGTTLCSS